MIILLIFGFLSLYCFGMNNTEPIVFSIIANPTPPYNWYPFGNYPLTKIDKKAGNTISTWQRKNKTRKTIKISFLQHGQNLQENLLVYRK